MKTSPMSWMYLIADVKSVSSDRSISFTVDGDSLFGMNGAERFM